MSVLHQPSMFDEDVTAGPALGDLSTTTRTELSDGAWVDHRPGWLTGSEQVLDTLLRDVPWRAEERQPPDRFVTAGLCLYRDGADSVAWHGDRIGRGATQDTMVAILSVGSGRTLALRPRGGGAGPRFHLGHGDLVVMGGSCQRTWEHAVPKTAKPVGPRISIQFRPIGVA